MSGIGARWQTLPEVLRDGLLAAALTVLGQVELVAADDVAGSRSLQHVAFAVMTASVGARRLRPLPAAVTCAAGLAGQTLLGQAPALAGFLAVLVVTYSVAQYADRRRDAVVGLLAVVAAIEVYPFVADGVRVADEVANAAIPVVLWVFARLARERLDRAVAAEREAAEARQRAREEELVAAAALSEERRRIAREMHDVVGHGVTLMLLHTDAAQARLAGREPEASAALDVVLASGRAAVEDLHRVLRVLQAGRGEDEEQPCTVAAIDSLVESAAAAGLEVALAVEGAVRELPAAVEATAYRVVQESVTNALRYARGARVRVLLRYTDGGLEIDVADDGGRALGTARTAPGGHGLAGIRERVALFDGRVAAGPRTDGPGWRTRVLLPVPVPAPVQDRVGA